MKAFAESLLRAFANRPDRVAVAELAGRQTVVLEARCDAEDVGRIIGKNGKTIGAMRVLLAAFAAKQKRRAVFEIAE